MVHLKFAKITIKGLYYLEENCIVERVYTECNEDLSLGLRDVHEEVLNLRLLTLKCPHCKDEKGKFADIVLSIPEGNFNSLATNASVMEKKPNALYYTHS